MAVGDVLYPQPVPWQFELGGHDFLFWPLFLCCLMALYPAIFAFRVKPGLRRATATGAQPTPRRRHHVKMFYFVSYDPKIFLSSIFVTVLIQDSSGTAHGVDFANAAAYLFFQKWGGVAELHFLQTKNAVPCSACALSALMANVIRIQKKKKKNSRFRLKFDQSRYQCHLSQLCQSLTAGSTQFAAVTQSHQS
jgi:hypothetical protein